MKIKTRQQSKGGGVSIYRNRIYILFFVVFALFGLVSQRLFNLQVKASDYYQQRAQGQHNLKTSLIPSRGNVYLRNGEELIPVAVNRKLATIYAIPRNIDNPLKVAEKLADILKVDSEKLRDKITSQEDLYEVVQKKVPEETLKKIKEADLEGIRFEYEDWRYYPGGQLASQTLGFVGFSADSDNKTGRYGVERFFEKNLKGESGVLEQEKDVFNQWISVGEKSFVPAKDGEDVILTLDYVLQFKAEKILEAAVERYQARGAKMIVMDPRDGNLLVLAATPGFNPNSYASQTNIANFRNPLISDEYECGSVFKPITMAIGIDSGKVSPGTVYYDEGEVEEAGFPIKNWDEKAHGEQTMTQVLGKSLNTGVIFVEKQVGNRVFLRYLEDFGFGETTGIQLPSEARGNLSNLKSGRNIEYYTASFGQGITVTPLQLVTAYGAMANGGELVTPRVVDYLEKPSGEKQVFKSQIKKSVISSSTARQVTEMMATNIDQGHGRLAGVPGYRIAGKTGTAQIPNPEGGGYLEGEAIGSFAGYGPVEDPRFVMAVIVDRPQEVEWAEHSAAPVFGEMAKVILDYYGVEPSRNYTQEELKEFYAEHDYLGESSIDLARPWSKDAEGAIREDD